MSSDTSQVATALLTEHLQYTPLSLIDDIIDSVNNLVYQGVGSLETGLFGTPAERLGFKSAPNTTNIAVQFEQEYPDAKQEIEEGLHKLETLLNSTVDKNFDKFEIYVLRNILSVPEDVAKWVRLGHYEGVQYPPGANAPDLSSIHLLRQKLVASRDVNKLLQREQRRNEAILARLRAMTEMASDANQEPNLSFLSNSQAAHFFTNQPQQGLTATTTFTTSQLPAFKTVLTELRSKLVALKTSPTAADTAKDERREERREYIEQRTKSHLERTGQTFTDNTGAFDNRNIDLSEVEALEKVAEIFRAT